ncbi:lasso peptide biosynthesis PqqD family chaperone [Streptomyces marispadix]|uniref:Lasso peptide biosynthesis PqqD family chaperone n=1 Tax=Streptomyces marispadix TaxID=2922868 RepID=A0ABS9T5I2_9ACTN|nr:lasso peptide biosynthesis PqqD family chaperone [Streptomyces marispadix]MCH6163782.1 lasso peptide biosynthesis PqqD family chaperone [Streptomyces marispadix]
MSNSGTVRLRPYVSATETESGMVLLDQRTGRYWQLNDTASLVLRGLLDGATTEEVAARLAARHPEASGRSADDVASLVRGLEEARLTTRKSP